MNIEIQVLKGIPEKQINKFQDRTIYNTAVFTREETKALNAYPVRSGELKRQEIAQQIIGNNKEYGLGSGVNYAHRVYKYENVNWTNKSTLPHWYTTVLNKQGKTILANAVKRALKEIN
jgi:hypothetical protein